MNERNLNQLDGCGNVFWNRENEKQLGKISKKRTENLIQACAFFFPSNVCKNKSNVKQT